MGSVLVDVNDINTARCLLNTTTNKEEFPLLRPELLQYAASPRRDHKHK
jgi:hypothetical protein